MGGRDVAAAHRAARRGHRAGQALLLVLTSRPERDHASWRVREDLARELPHRTTRLSLSALPGKAGRELLHALVGATVPAGRVETRILEPAEGNPFFLEEIVRTLIDDGAWFARRGLAFDPRVDVEVPPTVEQVILARIDRLQPTPTPP